VGRRRGEVVLEVGIALKVVSAGEGERVDRSKGRKVGVVLMGICTEDIQRDTLDEGGLIIG
jgi:hypothetical protein